MATSDISATDIKQAVEDLKKEKPQYSALISSLGGPEWIGTTIRGLILASPGASFATIMGLAQDTFSVVSNFLIQLEEFLDDLQDKLISEAKENVEEGQELRKSTMRRIQRLTVRRRQAINRNTR